MHSTDNHRGFCQVECFAKNNKAQHLILLLGVSLINIYHILYVYAINNTINYFFCFYTRIARFKTQKGSKIKR